MTTIVGNYKEYAGFKYPLTFPEDWILYEFKGTGRECLNCVGHHNDGYAMWRGVILGYCSNCAYEYHYNRGPGFYRHGREMLYKCPEKSAYLTYLQGIDLEEVGDLSINPEDTLENNKHVVEEINEIIAENELYEETMSESYRCTCLTCLEEYEQYEEEMLQYESDTDTDSDSLW